MRRLMRNDRDERGAVIIIVALVGTTLLVLSALVVDVGSILDERRQLQNAADAAALGVAQTCVGQATCPVNVSRTNLAADLANRNSKDDLSAVDSLVIDSAARTVTVQTSTKTSGGTILPYWFGKTVAGEAGKTVHATAVASYGGLGRASVIPLTLSRCEFDRATTNGTVYNVQTTILFHTQASTCRPGGSGADLPGGYGWVRDNNDSDTGDCNVTPAVGNILNDDTGLPGTPHSCDLTTLLGKDVLVPIYDQLSGTGVNGTYRIYGFGEFHLTGFFFSNQDKGTVGAGYPCRQPDTCLGGYFVRFVGVGDPGGPNLGNRVFLVS